MNNDINRIPAPAYEAEAERPFATDYQRKHAEEAAMALGDSFTWSDSAEGSSFWSAVYYRLRAIANGQPLK